MEGTCYDPEVYKKSDKGNIEPIYSAGNETAHFMVSSSDNEPEDQVVVIAKKRKRESKKKNKKRLNTLTMTDVFAILHMSLKLISRPISVRRLFELLPCNSGIGSN